MHFDYSRMSQGLLAFSLILGAEGGQAQARKTVPTAMLPIEPASPDPEILDDQKGSVIPVEKRESTPARARTPLVSGDPEVSVRGGLLMSRDGFGAQLRFLEHASPWLAVVQSLRYQAQEDENAFFATQYGLMLGLEAHPWRQARLSPVMSLEAGGDRYRRSWNQEDLDLFGFAAAAGLELRLARAASFLFQWTELYYPGLKEELFVDQKPGTRYAGSFQVFFNLKWEGAL
jgi:hypothetical protein